MEALAQRLTPRRGLIGLTIAIVSFSFFGTIAALWQNPFFVRMTPAGNWEISLLFVLSFLIGTYVAIQRPACSNKAAGTGSILGVLGVMCPVCNQLLLFVFGGELLLTYFEPIRIYVTAIGVLIVGWAVVNEWRKGNDENLPGILT